MTDDRTARRRAELARQRRVDGPFASLQLSHDLAALPEHVDVGGQLVPRGLSHAQDSFDTRGGKRAAILTVSGDETGQ